MVWPGFMIHYFNGMKVMSSNSIILLSQKLFWIENKILTWAKLWSSAFIVHLLKLWTCVHSTTSPFNTIVSQSRVWQSKIKMRDRDRPSEKMIGHESESLNNFCWIDRKLCLQASLSFFLQLQSRTWYTHTEPTRSSAFLIHSLFYHSTIRNTIHDLQKSITHLSLDKWRMPSL